MNLADILKYGHQTVVDTVDGLPEDQWEKTGVCGQWSVKDIVAHLASFEHILTDVLNGFLGGGPTPYLERWSSKTFNDDEVAARRRQTPAQVLAEYTDAYAKNMSLAVKIPAEKCREPGTLPWYGAEYSLDDFVVYTYYGHKREHCAQIKLYRKKMG
jgi:hypothetical protein